MRSINGLLLQALLLVLATVFGFVAGIVVSRSRAESARTWVEATRGQPQYFQLARWTGSKLNVRLTSDTRRHVDVNPPTADFVFNQRDIQAQRVLRIVNNTDRPMQLSNVRCDQASFQTSVTALKPGEEFELTISVQGPFVSGATMAMITMETNLPDYPTLTIPANVYKR